MPRLSQLLINALAENKIAESLTLEDAADLGGLLQGPFEAALLKGLKENYTVKHLVCKETNPKTMEILGSVCSRLKHATRFETMSFQAVPFESMSFFLTNLTPRDFPCREVKFINLDSKVVELCKPFLMDKRDEPYVVITTGTSHLYISNLDKYAVAAVTACLASSECKIKALNIEYIGAQELVDLIRELEKGLMHKIGVYVHSLDAQALDLVCKEVLTRRLVVRDIHLPDKSTIESVNKLKALQSELSRKRPSPVSASRSEGDVLFGKKQMVSSPSHPTLSSASSSLPQFFVPLPGPVIPSLPAASSAALASSSQMDVESSVGSKPR